MLFTFVEQLRCTNPRPETSPQPTRPREASGNILSSCLLQHLIHRENQNAHIQSEKQIKSMFMAVLLYQHGNSAAPPVTPSVRMGYLRASGHPVSGNSSRWRKRSSASERMLKLLLQPRPPKLAEHLAQRRFCPFEPARRSRRSPVSAAKISTSCGVCAVFHSPPHACSSGSNLAVLEARRALDALAARLPAAHVHNE